MQNVDPVLESDGIKRSIGIAVVIFNDLDDTSKFAALKP